MKLPQIYRPKRRLHDEVTPAEPNDDDSWEEDGPNRAVRVRKALLIGLVLAVVFLGGVQAQKHWGHSGSSAASGLPSGIPSDIANQLGSGGLPGGASGGGGPSSSGTSDTPAVIGKVTKVDGKTVTVTDVSGTEHTVEMDASTSLTRSKKIASTDIDAGESVVVVGTTDRDGRIAATSMTLR